jgi:hypothetical protein
MRFTPTKKISELEALTSATLDTTFVVGISGSTTYKISINQLTSSLDGAFATDLVTNALSNSLDTKLATTIFNTNSASFHSRINAVSSSVSTGTSGTSGTSGAQGNQGPIGPQGINGTAGSSGVQGPQGNQGVNGSNGTSGTNGAQGNQGPTGAQGNQGVDGSSGTSGTNGSQGTQGPQGEVGPQGISGTAGSSGVQGAQGNQGATGSGTQGAQGPTGPQGNQGNQGPTGPQGTQGTDGTTFNISQYSGSVGITGSLTVSSIGISDSAFLTNTSSLTLTSGSNIYVQNSGIVEITGSLILSGSTNFTELTGSLALFSSSINNRIVSGSAVAGTISGSSQISALGYATTSSLTTLSSSVDTRLDTLEATIISGSPNYTQVLGNRRTGITSIGVSIISGSITTTGNPVQIMVTGDANPIGGASYTRLQIFRDESGIGGIVQVENSANLNVPYCVNVIDTPSAGTYTYSMRTVGTFGGTFDFGEASGPLLTAVELKTNTNLPSTNNTFTGTNTFRGETTMSGSLVVSGSTISLTSTVLQVGTGSGDEGGEILLAKSQTNNSLTGSGITIDSYQNRLRIFEQGGNARGVHIDLTKAPDGVNGELLWKASGIVNAGTFVTLDNIKVTITTTGSRGLSVATVSGTVTGYISGQYQLLSGSPYGASSSTILSTTATSSMFGWNFVSEGDMATYIIRDNTNNRVYRIIMIIGGAYNNNFISIERLF